MALPHQDILRANCTGMTKTNTINKWDGDTSAILLMANILIRVTAMATCTIALILPISNIINKTMYVPNHYIIRTIQTNKALCKEQFATTQPIIPPYKTTRLQANNTQSYRNSSGSSKNVSNNNKKHSKSDFNNKTRYYNRMLRHHVKPLRKDMRVPRMVKSEDREWVSYSNGPLAPQKS
ncbi:hypothetical protein GOBAR_DD17223 [Gossypium barbadense]|nr:hypothetical protein GOBAR_DD17223 [Gossypium barbadense]